MEPADPRTLVPGTAFRTAVRGIFPRFGPSAGTDKEDPGLSRIARAFGALLTILALAGVAALGTLGVMRARDDAIARSNAAARDRARTIAQLIHDEITSDLDAVVATTTRPLVSLNVAQKKYVPVIPYLSELIATHQRLVSVGIYDAGGTLAVRIPGDASIAGRRFGQQEYFKTARNDPLPHISNLFVQLGKPKVPVIAYSLRLYRFGGVQGVLVGTTPITAFDTMVAPYASAGSIVRIYNASGERISPSSEASGKTYTTDPVVGPTLSGRSSVRRGGGSIIAAAPVADFGWAVVVSQQSQAGDKRVQDLTVRLSLLAGGATLLALIATAAAWRRKSPNAG
jgi:hypothetical protein